MPRKAHGMSRRYATPLKSRRSRRRTAQVRVGEGLEGWAPEHGERGARLERAAVAAASSAEAASPTLLAEYRIVMADLRRIGMVAGPLILLIVVLALFLR